MKKLLFIPIALAMMSAQKPGQKTSGQFEGLRNDTMIVLTCKVADILRAQREPDSYTQQDTLVVRNGKLKIDFPVESPTYFTIRPMQTIRLIERDHSWFQPIGDINFFLDKGENVEFKVTAVDSITMDYTLAGSAVNKSWSALRAETQPINRTVARLIMQCSLNLPQQELDSITQIIIPTLHKQQSMQTKYIRENPGDPLSGFLLINVPIDSASFYLQMLKPEVRESMFRPLLDQVAINIEAEKAQQRAIEHLQTGVDAPDFTLKTIAGDDFKLSSLRGKYVILDFWGSWCEPCLRAMPKLKEYHAKYADKLEIVGIACMDTEAKWRKAVADNALPWINVINPMGAFYEQDLVIQYGIRGFPSLVLIGPDGRIRSIGTFRSSDFYAQVDKYLE